MSCKDRRYFRNCPICQDRLPGTDDGLEVFESLKEQVAEIKSGQVDYDTPNCTLCGEDCPMKKAEAILLAGEPTLEKA